MAGEATKSVAPGTELIVRAGEMYEIEDDKHEVVGIVAKESEWTIDFLTLFDEWRELSRGPGINPMLTNMAWQKLIAKWQCMPPRLRRELPSSLPIRVPTIGT
jgi:hypothetical protein